jgi:hypothetical protein
MHDDLHRKERNQAKIHHDLDRKQCDHDEEEGSEKKMIRPPGWPREVFESTDVHSVLIKHFVIPFLEVKPRTAHHTMCKERTSLDDVQWNSDLLLKEGVRAHRTD